MMGDKIPPGAPWQGSDRAAVSKAGDRASTGSRRNHGHDGRRATERVAGATIARRWPRYPRRVHDRHPAARTRGSVGAALPVLRRPEYSHLRVARHPRSALLQRFIPARFRATGTYPSWRAAPRRKRVLASHQEMRRAMSASAKCGTRTPDDAAQRAQDATGLEAAMASDRQYFAARPTATQRRRPFVPR